ncbi:MAG: hypothetical protein WC516_04020 [Patescibacteria group bacterium]
MSTDQNYEKLFSHLASVELPSGFFVQTLQRLESEKKRLLVRHRRIAIVSLVGLVFSAVAFIPSLKFIWSEFAASSFMEFFSLIFSDAGMIVTYWQSFAPALLESLPFMGVIILLAVVAIFLESLRFLVRDIKFIFKFNQ